MRTSRLRRATASAVNYAGGMGECLAGIGTGAGGRRLNDRGKSRAPPLNAAGWRRYLPVPMADRRAHSR